MAKTLIKGINSENSISKTFEFREASKEITLTGTGEKVGEEHLDARISADKFIVYNLESDDVYIHFSPFSEGIIPKISLEKIKDRTFELFCGEKKIDLSGKEIENLEIRGEIENIDLKEVKDLNIEYWNSGSQKCEKLKVENGGNFNIRGRRYGGKKMFIKEMEFNDVKKVILTDCFLVKSKKVYINVDRIVLNQKILDEFERLLNKEKGNFFFRARIVGLTSFESFQGILSKLIKLVKLAREKNHNFSIERITIGDIWRWIRDDERNDEERDNGESVSFEKVEKKDFNIRELLEIRNIELRREIVEYLGGIEKLVKKEKEKELIERTDKGELWCIGDENDPRRCIKFLKYKDVSTNREYLSFVPPDISNVLEGFSWKFQVEPTEYQNLTAEG